MEWLINPSPPKKNSVKIASVMAKIRTGQLPHTNQKRYGVREHILVKSISQFDYVKVVCMSDQFAL